MKLKAFVFLLFITFSGFNYLSASEVVNGYLRLILSESSGRYLIYFLSSPNSSRYEALFSSDDMATSYATILMDGKVYRLGGKYFKNKFEKQSNGFPSFIFEGENLKVTQIFTPIKSANSKYVNGVMVTYRIQNTGSEEAATGLRILIDTVLGEKLSKNFLTGEQVIKNETLLEGHCGERFWISRGKNTALMGSIINPVDPSAKAPDFIHFANWKRLNDAPWKIKHVKKRSFTNAPFSINDSAVCYYFDPQILNPGKEFSYSIVLSTEDIEWYNSLDLNAPPAAAAVPAVKTAPAISAASAATPTPAQAAAPVSRQTPPDVSASSANIPAAQPPIETSKSLVTSTIDIKQIELDAYAEAMAKDGVDGKSIWDINAHTLKKYQEILNQFIAGEIALNEQDIIDLEKAIEKFR